MTLVFGPIREDAAATGPHRPMPAPSASGSTPSPSLVRRSWSARCSATAHMPLSLYAEAPPEPANADRAKLYRKVACCRLS